MSKSTDGNPGQVTRGRFWVRGETGPLRQSSSRPSRFTSVLVFLHCGFDRLGRFRQIHPLVNPLLKFLVLERAIAQVRAWISPAGFRCEVFSPGAG